MPIFEEITQLNLLEDLDSELLFANTPVPLNASIQGQYSVEINSLTADAHATLTHPDTADRPCAS